jgi:hypothetical protein
MYTVNQDGSVTLDTGEKVLVTLERERLSNGGLVFKAKAVLDGDASVVSEMTHTAYVGFIHEYGEEVIARGLLRALLGEVVECPGLLFSTDFLNSVNIRNHIKLANAPELEPSSLL